MKSSIKIISNVGKWTKFKYISSNASSRMDTQKLIDDQKNGLIDVVNPWMLDN